MKIVSWNINGIRSAARKGALAPLNALDADVICLQETRSSLEFLSGKSTFFLAGNRQYYIYDNLGKIRGYAGVAILTANPPLSVEKCLGLERFDKEGRIICLHYRKFSVICIYIPHGGRNKENIDYKLSVYRQLYRYLEANSNRRFIVCGDFNVARHELDLVNYKTNANNTMFTRDERKCLDKMINLGFDDSFRTLNPTERRYTWWPYAHNARARDLGWRIDYIFTSSWVTDRLRNALILGDIVGSDHCPTGVELCL